MEYRPKGICARLRLLMSDSGRFAPVSAGYQLGPLRSENRSLRWLENDVVRGAKRPIADVGVALLIDVKRNPTGVRFFLFASLSNGKRRVD